MFQISTMANLEPEFHELLTHPCAKHDEEINICSSTPQAQLGNPTWFCSLSAAEQDGYIC